MSKRLTVPYIEQIEDFFCGAAAAQMILNFRQVPPPEPDMSITDWQRAIWADIGARTTGPERPVEAKGAHGYIEEFEGQVCVLCGPGRWNCWATTPQALSAVLNMHVSPTHHVGIVRNRDAAEFALAAILESIDQDSPAAALIDNGGHWVVVRGYKADQATPEPISVRNRSLNGVYILDPADASAAMQRLIPATEFEGLLSPAACAPSLDNGRFVVVVDRDVSGAPPPRDRPSRREPAPMALLSPADIIERAVHYANGLLQEDEGEPLWEAALRDVTPGKPELVQQLDRDDTFYYVVPFARHGQITARLAINAKTGRLREVGAVEEVDKPLTPWRDAEDFFRRFEGRRIDSDEFKDNIVVKREQAVVSKTLVWRSSRQSRSLLRPFTKITIDGTEIFYRVDGALFPELTTRGPGR